MQCSIIADNMLMNDDESLIAKNIHRIDEAEVRRQIKGKVVRDKRDNAIIDRDTPAMKSQLSAVQRNRMLHRKLAAQYV